MSQVGGSQAPYSDFLRFDLPPLSNGRRYAVIDGMLVALTRTATRSSSSSDPPQLFSTKRPNRAMLSFGCGEGEAMAEQLAGPALAVAAYVMWRYLPYHIKAIAHKQPADVVAHPVTWSVPSLQ